MNKFGKRYKNIGTGLDPIYQLIGGGGGANFEYLSTPEVVFSYSSVGGVSSPTTPLLHNTYQAYSIPSSIPSDAGGIIVRFESRADEAYLEMFAKTSSWSERRVCRADGRNNSDDAASDINTFVIPYSSTIDIKVNWNGGGNEQAHFYIDGYIAGGGSGGGGTGGPTGSIISFAGTSAPNGYLLCDGSLLNTYTYRELHAVISNTYGGTEYEGGVTDDPTATTTFRVPDLRGRVVAGRDDMGGTSANRLTNPTGSTINGIDGNLLGNTGGHQTHLNTAAQSGLPAHSHTQGLSGPNLSGPVESLSGGSAGGRYTNTGTTGGTSASSSHNNVQPTIILNYLIKT